MNHQPSRELDGYEPAILEPAAAVETLRMRCPNCRKLYSVEMRHLQSSVQAPKFDCIGCQSQFAVELPIQLGTPLLETYLIEPSFPASDIPQAPSIARAPVEKVPQVESRTCPKCGSRSPMTSEDCASCGIVFSRYKPDTDESYFGDLNVVAKREISALWEAVVENYESELTHDRFVRACQEAKCLSFAAHKYSKILSAAPGEELALKMQKQVMAYASHKFEHPKERGGWKFRVPGFNGLAIFLGTSVTLMGLLLPNMNNMTGIGISLLALSIGVRFFLRGPN